MELSSSGIDVRLAASSSIPKRPHPWTIWPTTLPVWSEPFREILTFGSIDLGQLTAPDNFMFFSRPWVRV